MERFLQYVLAGLSAGSLYALVALGLVLIYRSTRVLNFAHADMATVGTFIAFSMITSGLPFWIRWDSLPSSRRVQPFRSMARLVAL